MKRVVAVVQAVLLFAVCVGVALPVGAQPSAAELKQRVQERAQRINEYRALLEDKDPSLRLAALDEMLKSDDVAMREMAYGMAFTSTDDAMRSVALKQRILELQNIVIKVALRENARTAEKRTYSKWGGVYAFGITNVDATTGRFGTDGEGTGQVVGTSLQFFHKYCSGSFKLGDDAVLTGTLGCHSKWRGEFGGTITLQ